MTRIERILIQFGKKWFQAEENNDTEYTRRRQKQLIKWAIKKIFFEH